jgi:hypothetical protein
MLASPIPRDLRVYKRRIDAGFKLVRTPDRGKCVEWSVAKGRPISGVLDTAVSWMIMGPATKAVCPDLIAPPNAPAIRTGSSARETGCIQEHAVESQFHDLGTRETGVRFPRQ